MKTVQRLANYYLLVIAIVFTLLLFFTVKNSNAQDRVTGAFEGQVVDTDTEQPLKDVVVQFTNENTKSEKITRTDSRGRFYQGLLDPGDYIIEIAAPWYRTVMLRRILLVSRTGEVVPTPIKLTSSRQNSIKPSNSSPQNVADKRSTPRAISQNIDESKLPLGKYYALVIGNNDYQHVRKLKMAKTDAQAAASVLQNQFGFETKLILDATRQAILSAIYNFRQTLGENDNLLIYYSGHGFYDSVIEEAYWIPVDARTDDNANWISASDITKNIKGIKAKHILVVSDSYYSGTIDRQLGITEIEGTTAREKYLQKIVVGKSRTLMASGGNEPVMDGGGGKYSVFANAFLLALNEMDGNVFTANEMFHAFVQERVAGNSEQTPEYNPLKNSGHESGDFVFVRRKESK